MQGKTLHDEGYFVGPPWYLPIPIHGTDPLEYEYEGRVWYGETPEAQSNAFYSHLYLDSKDALGEADRIAGEISASGYLILGPVELQAVQIGSQILYRSTFLFGLTETGPIVMPTPEDKEGISPVAMLASVGLLFVTVLGIGLIAGRSQK
jgi:hypothetical protein